MLCSLLLVQMAGEWLQDCCIPSKEERKPVVLGGLKNQWDKKEMFLISNRNTQGRGALWRERAMVQHLTAERARPPGKGDADKGRRDEAAYVVWHIQEASEHRTWGKEIAGHRPRRVCAALCLTGAGAVQYVSCRGIKLHRCPDPQVGWRQS